MRNFARICMGLSVLSMLGQQGAVAVTQTTSETFVAVAKTVSGGNGSAYGLSWISQQVVRPVVSEGTVTENPTGNTLTDANATWADDAFNSTASGALPTHYVEFDGGFLADVVDTDGVSKTITLGGSIAGLINQNDAYRIRQHATISSYFGPNNEAGLLSGTEAVLADNIIFRKSSTGGFHTVFFYDDGNFTGWFTASFSPAADLVIYPEFGMIIRHRSQEDLLIFESGVAKKGPTRVPVLEGINILGTIRVQENIRLSDLGLFTGDPNTGIAPGTEAVLADNLIVRNPAGNFRTYFYFDDPDFGGWYSASFVPSDDVEITAGSAFYIRRRAAGSFDWSIPAEFNPN